MGPCFLWHGIWAFTHCYCPTTLYWCDIVFMGPCFLWLGKWAFSHCYCPTKLNCCDIVFMSPCFPWHGKWASLGEVKPPRSHRRKRGRQIFILGWPFQMASTDDPPLLSRVRHIHTPLSPAMTFYSQWLLLTFPATAPSPIPSAIAFGDNPTSSLPLPATSAPIT